MRRKKAGFLPTPHSSLLTPHSPLPPPPLPTPHSLTLPTPHRSLPTPHHSLPTPHRSLPTPHSSLLTPHSPLLTPHSPLPTSSLPGSSLAFRPRPPAQHTSSHMPNNPFAITPGPTSSPDASDPARPQAWHPRQNSPARRSARASASSPRPPVGQGQGRASRLQHRRSLQDHVASWPARGMLAMGRENLHDRQGAP